MARQGAQWLSRDSGGDSAETRTSSAGKDEGDGEDAKGKKREAKDNGLEADRRALCAVFEALDGRHWCKADGWCLPETPLRDWFGVALHHHHDNDDDHDDDDDVGQYRWGRVRGLALPQNNLRGHLPEEIGLLTELQFLVLRDNRIREVPNTIGRCRRLCLLDLQRTEVKELPFAGLRPLVRTQLVLAEQDRVRAQPYIEDGAACGDGPALLELAAMHLVGHGVPQSVRRAAEIYETILVANPEVRARAATALAIFLADRHRRMTEDLPTLDASLRNVMAVLDEEEGNAAQKKNNHRKKSPGNGQMVIVESQDARRLWAMETRVPRDRQQKRVFQLCRIGAHDGMPEALVQLGHQYRLGFAFPQNFDGARAFYALAVSCGSEQGALHLALAFLRGQGSGGPHDVQSADALYATACETKHPSAFLASAMRLVTGHSIQEDIPRGCALLQTAAELGSPRASMRLAVMLAAGAGVPCDPERAGDLLRVAVAHGNGEDPTVVRNLAQLFVRGHGVCRDHEKARILFRMLDASDIRDDMALSLIGLRR